MKGNLRRIWMMVLLIIWMIPINIYADMGPKPSIVVEFEGIEEELYYVTLLSKTETTGPYSFGVPQTYLVEEDKKYGTLAAEAFRNYQDEDDFYFIEFFQRCNKAQTFTWGYYPPETFKVLIYLPQREQFICTSYS